MCLAIYRPANAPGCITQDDLENGFQSNNDAFGVMWAWNGKLEVWKSTDLKEWPTFLALMESLQDQNAPLAAHLRFATHGGDDLANAHPFEVLPGKLGIVHNGIIDQLAFAKSSDSDTALFAKQLRQLPRRWYNNATIRTLLEDYLGRGNKVVILAHTGVARILNERDGAWDRGIWWSNSGYKYDRDWWTSYEAWKAKRDAEASIEYKSAKKLLTAGTIVDAEMDAVNARGIHPVATVYHDGTLLCPACGDWCTQITSQTTPVALLFEDDVAEGTQCESCGAMIEGTYMYRSNSVNR